MSEQPKIIVVEDFALPDYPSIYQDLADIYFPGVSLTFVRSFAEARELLQSERISGLVSEAYSKKSDGELIRSELEQLRADHPTLPICVWSDAPLGNEEPFIHFRKSQWKDVCEFFLPSRRKNLW